MCFCSGFDGRRLDFLAPPGPPIRSRDYTDYMGMRPTNRGTQLQILAFRRKRHGAYGSMQMWGKQPLFVLWVGAGAKCLSKVQPTPNPMEEK